MTTRITYAVANLRMGGQVSSLVSMADLVRRRGFDVAFAFPRGVDADKETLSRFGDHNIVHRGLDLLQLLRALPAGADDIVHLMLPTPSFAPLALLASTSSSSMVLQYEGHPTALDAEHLQLLKDDPLLLAPRLLLNHRLVGHSARLLQRATHLATTPQLARYLRRIGCPRVLEVANVAGFDDVDRTPLPHGLLEPDTITVGYVGHCHPVKGVDDLVDAFALAAPRQRKLRLVLALSGDGDRRRIEDHVAALPTDVRARVKLAGLVPVASMLAGLDALVLPWRSLATTTLYPSLLLEADLAGCPLVVSSVPEVRRIVDPRAERLQLVRPHDPSRLADALCRVSARVDGDRRSVLLLPDSDTRADQLCAAYASIAAEPR